MFQPERMETLYYSMDSSPLSDLSDLNGGWSPVSGFSDQENYPALVDNANGNAPIFGNSCASNSPDSATSVDLKAVQGGVSKRHRNPARKSHQRNAANQRERKRMKIINDAFDGLRDRIPLDCSERKLSKVDTLRLAIRYIQHLSEMIDSCGGTSGSGQTNGNGRNAGARVIIRCHNQGYPDACDEEYHHMDSYPPLYGHSLSWQDHKEAVTLAPVPGADTNKLCAKVWMPNLASPEDLAALHEMTP